jgi:hypothetical protein
LRSKRAKFGLDVRLGRTLANVPAAATDGFKASADRLFNAALERVKELAAAYAGTADPCVKQCSNKTAKSGPPLAIDLNAQRSLERTLL